MQRCVRAAARCLPTNACACRRQVNACEPGAPLEPLLQQLCSSVQALLGATRPLQRAAVLPRGVRNILSHELVPTISDFSVAAFAAAGLEAKAVVGPADVPGARLIATETRP